MTKYPMNTITPQRAGEATELQRQLLAVIEADAAQMKRFFERMHRGDPRICKPEYANPNYFEKFGQGDRHGSKTQA